jgi:hypothetical protein
MSGALLCADCYARVIRDGQGHISPAATVLDGRALCESHALPMIKLIAERMTANEHRDDPGQG